MLATYNCLRAKPIELQLFIKFADWVFYFLESFAKKWKKYLLNRQNTSNPIFCNAPLQVQDITEVDCHDG